MLRSRRHYDCVAVFDSVLNPVNENFAFAFLKSEELVCFYVGFQAYSFQGFEVHQNKLAILACVKHSSKIRVFSRLFFD